jgi:hypothetical protein
MPTVLDNIAKNKSNTKPIIKLIVIDPPLVVNWFDSNLEYYRKKIGYI